MIRCVWEHNGPDTLLYAADYPGAFTRGETLNKAMEKMTAEIHSYCRWAGLNEPDDKGCQLIQEKTSSLLIRDADSDVLFDTERLPLSVAEYENLKTLALASARDFQKLYEAVPDHHQSCVVPRKTFYSQIPRTAQEMYDHTRSVNSYYFAEIGVEADNSGTIAECRARGFALLERQPDFLQNSLFEGSYDELWTLRKVLRRFIWHDRIHSRAMYRMAQKTFPGSSLPDPFHFFE